MIAKNVLIYDGQTYYPGQEIWELGSLKATDTNGKIRNYEGLQKDLEKLPHYVGTGSSCFMIDSGKFYKYEKTTDSWYEV